MRNLLVFALIGAVFLTSTGLHSAARIHADIASSGILATIVQLDQSHFRCEGTNPFAGFGNCVAKLSALPQANALQVSAIQIEYVTADLTIAALNQPEFDPGPPKILV